jgi:methionine synthase II (cobalamin-independent)
MRRSTEQILTTHTGSLPRPRGLTEELAERDRTGATASRTIDVPP